MNCPEDKSFVLKSCQEFSSDAIHVNTSEVYKIWFTVSLLLKGIYSYLLVVLLGLVKHNF